MTITHPVHTLPARRTVRMEMEKANHRAHIAHTDPLPEVQWYNKKRFFNGKTNCSNKIMEAINGLQRAVPHLRGNEEALPVVEEAYFALIMTWNFCNQHRDQLPLEINATMSNGDTDKYYAYLISVIKSLWHAHDSAKDFDYSTVKRLEETQAALLGLLPKHMIPATQMAVKPFKLDTTVDERYIDQTWESRPVELQRRGREA